MFSVILEYSDDREAFEEMKELYLIEKDQVQLKLHTFDLLLLFTNFDENPFFKVGAAKRYSIFFIERKCVP